MSVERFDPIAYINEPRWQHSRLGLERTQALLAALGHPEQKLRFVHVAGTNGKGSTCAYLASILECAGYRCGLFTSPYIEHFEERIQVNGCSIDLDDLRTCTLRVKEAADQVEDVLGEHPTEFELMCAVALIYFAQEHCDIVVMEVGLGGRLDSTNVIMPDLCIITKIGLDHCAILGDTIEQIAFEKAGIIKEGIWVVSAHQSREARDVIERTCYESASKLIFVDPHDIKDGGIDVERGCRCFAFQEQEYITHLLGSYQPENASLAIMGAHALGTLGDWNISFDAICHGIEQARWPGRFELVSKNPLCIVDGAHNPDGAHALVRSLEDMQEADGVALHKGITFVVGVLLDKDYPAMIASVLKFASEFITYTPDNPRSLDAQVLAEEIERQIVTGGFGESIGVQREATASDAMCVALKKRGPKGCVVAFGTLYALSDIKRAVRRCTRSGITPDAN